MCVVWVVWVVVVALVFFFRKREGRVDAGVVVAGAPDALPPPGRVEQET